MPQKYKEFSYLLPAETAEYYANNALKILRDVSKVSLSVVAKLLMRTDVLLTLSGVRSLTLYIDDFNKFLDRSEIDRVLKVLESYGIHLFPEKVTVLEDDEDLGYIMINEEALKLIPEQYTLSVWEDMLPPFNYDRFLAWKYCLEKSIYREINNGTLPNRWKNDFWAPYHIIIGIMLGYPGEAISSSLGDGSWELEYEDADIPYEGPYYGTSVAYSFSRDIRNDSNIVAHQKLWRGIISKIHNSDWHKEFKKSLESKIK